MYLAQPMESSMAEPASPEANLATMKRAFEALARKDLGACVALLTPDFQINLAGVPYQASGHKAWLSNAGQMIRAFPDLGVRIDDMFASGATVAVRVRFSGTQPVTSWGSRPVASASTTKARKSTVSRTVSWLKSGSLR